VADRELRDLIRQCRGDWRRWNEWRKQHPERQLDLTHVRFTGDFLQEFDLCRADLRRSLLVGTHLFRANLSEANLSEATLGGADLREANLAGANLSGAVLEGANLSGANLSGANLMQTNLEHSILVRADLRNANLSLCRIYGAAAWDLNLTGAVQKNLVVTPLEQTPIGVDDLQVAQFIYLLLNNKNIRDVINTIGRKAVLILGRFTDNRMEILEGIAERLRELGFLPIVFNFEKPTDRDITETVMTLASLSLFVIADLTKPRSSPLELQTTIPNYMIPFATIIQEGEEPFGMFRDLVTKFDWVLPPVSYQTKEQIVAGLEVAVIKPALAMHNRLMQRKAQALTITSVDAILNRDLNNSSGG
jgi:uncharacterized protein YjbI with pentapeptide repeats